MENNFPLRLMTRKHLEHSNWSCQIEVEKLYIETNDLRKEKNCFQQLQFTFEGCALSNRVPLFVFKVGSESRLSDILSQMMSTRRSNTA